MHLLPPFMQVQEVSTAADGSQELLSSSQATKKCGCRQPKLTAPAESTALAMQC